MAANLILLVGSTVTASCVVALGALIFSLKRNIDNAKASGLPYIIAPFAFLETHWLLLQPFLLPFLKYLPQKWTHSWLPLSVLIEIWRAAYLPFDHAGADTFLIVTPSSVNLWTCDAEVNEQILAVGRRNHFPKSVELLGVMRSWGPALPGAEGDEARLYRKVTAPCFNEGTHKKVWQYGIERTSLVIREEWKCEGIPQPKSGTIVDIVKSCKAWTLAVICCVCYGRKLELDENRIMPPGFDLSFSDAVTDAFHYFFMIFLVPKILLKRLPIKKCNEAYVAYEQWFKHLVAMRKEEKLRQSRMSENVSSSNILGTLVASEAPAGQSAGMYSDGIAYMSTEAVYGIMSNFIVAGHETTANTLSFIVTMLALNPGIQQKLHQELDYIFGPERIHRPETWSYEDDFPRLLNGLVGAVQNETLRLFPLSPTTTRKVLAPQELWIDGKCHVIPAGCRCFPNIPATHTNPRYWGAVLPQEKSTHHTLKDERSCPSQLFVKSHKLLKWDPMRWLSQSQGDGLGDAAFVADPKPSSESGKNYLFGQIRTVKSGVFLPFSRGPRGCIGTRFAQVELCAFMARLFAECKVQVDPASYGSENKARAETVEQITTRATTTLTYKPADNIRLRVVPRHKKE